MPLPATVTGDESASVGIFYISLLNDFISGYFFLPTKVAFTEPGKYSSGALQVVSDYIEAAYLLTEIQKSTLTG